MDGVFTVLLASGALLRADPPCVITNEAQAFKIVSIAQDTNGGITLTWESCTNYLYEVQGSDLWGEPSWWVWGPVSEVIMGGDGTTSWTDVSHLSLDSALTTARFVQKSMLYLVIIFC